MEKKPNILAQVLDLLSSIKYWNVKKIIKCYVVVCCGFLWREISNHLVGNFQGEYVLGQIIWALGSCYFGYIIFSYIVYRWNRRNIMASPNPKYHQRIGPKVMLNKFKNYLRENSLGARFLTLSMIPFCYNICKWCTQGQPVGYIRLFKIAGFMIGAFLAHQLYYRWIFPEKRNPKES